MQVAERAEHLFTHCRIDTPGGLVGHQESRFEHESPRERHALALTAAQLVWQAIHEAEWQAHRIDDGRHGIRRLIYAKPAVTLVNRLGHVLGDAE